MVAIEGCYLATVDEHATEHPSGHLVFGDGRLLAVGAGELPARYAEAERVDGRGLLATPGLVNVHHHLYQWISRGLATDHTLFDWLTRLYPRWSRLSAELVGIAATANLAVLARSGCTTTSDHHYVFPAGRGDPLEATIEAARTIGLRFHPSRGSMDLGQSSGGLPPDDLVERHDAILDATQHAITKWHDPSPEAMVRIAVAPCSPFSVTPELMRDCAELAREYGVRLHTHLAETTDELDYCRQTYGRSPVEYAAELGWLGPDVWLAHGVQLDANDIGMLARSATSVAHCPTSNGRLGAGIAPVRRLIDAGVPVGLGVDGAASNESGQLARELHQAVLAARYLGGPTALSCRQALALATRGGAACLGRADELGSLEVGKLADIALWRLTDLASAGVADPIAALVLGTPSLARLYVAGREVVAGGVLLTADEAALAAAAASASRRLDGD
ncbi:MAG: 8-oxoguanine deaminase [Actinomycetota bacterium]|nr:8-oxoguanine deaminase [Actinomycetota bacterium]MDQ2956415.1 8-oxoguanine deaminase [Actinomycetota bacterium]